MSFASRLIFQFGTRTQPWDGPAGDQPRLVGAVDADHAAAGPAGQPLE